MYAFQIIPVLDLRSGVVVHARAGDRARYRPVQSPFAPADAPLAMARALLAVTGSPVLYLADLDAIEGRGDQLRLCRELAAGLPQTKLWADAGANTPAKAGTWLEAGIVPVIGSESLPEPAAFERLAGLDPRLVLSLDFKGDAFIGPKALLDDAAAWPERVIVMSLARVGSGEGPDLLRVKSIIDSAGGRHIYAAGGVRGLADLEALAEAGAVGALAASALHAEGLTQNEIAAFSRRRRSQS